MRHSVISAGPIGNTVPDTGKAKGEGRERKYLFITRAFHVQDLLNNPGDVTLGTQPCLYRAYIIRVSYNSGVQSGSMEVTQEGYIVQCWAQLLFLLGEDPSSGFPLWNDLSLYSQSM